MTRHEGLFALLAVLGATGLASPTLAFAGDGPALGTAEVAQISLPSHDLDRSVDFYRDRLGLRLQFRVPGAAFFKVGGLRLRIEKSDAPPGAANQVYFNDPGLASLMRLKARGVLMDGKPEIAQRKEHSDLMIQDFRDPDGNSLALMGEVTRK